MDFDGAVNAKAEIFQKVFGFRELASVQLADSSPSFAPAAGSEALEQIVTGRHAPRRDPRDFIAVGIKRPVAERSRSDRSKVALFLQRPRLKDHPYIAKAKALAKDEVEIFVTGPIRGQAVLNSGRCRPLRIGASIGHYRVTAGTLGCFAFHLTDKVIGLLSNNHVLARCNRAQTGDFILQPGRSDGGDVDDLGSHVARLHSLVELDFRPGATNFVDCAFATLLDGIAHVPDRIGDDPDTWALGPVNPNLLPGTGVKKLGRTTRTTEGTVVATDVDNLQVGYTVGGRQVIARFNGQISVAGSLGYFSKGGDSGSLIIDSENRPAALHFAGSESGGTDGRGLSFCNPLQNVLDALDLSIHV